MTRRYFSEGEVRPTAATNKRLYYARDHLGSVREVLDADTGVRLGSLDYDPYGLTVATNGTVFPDFGYAGMYLLQGWGLYQTHYRVYDANLTYRWLNRDPIGEEGGINLYAYVGGDPVNAVDPLGLDYIYGQRISDSNVIPNGGEGVTNINGFNDPIWAGRTFCEIAANIFFPFLRPAEGGVSLINATTRYSRQTHYGGSQTNSAAAKAARAAGEGQSCPTCGTMMRSGTPSAPSPQHEPPLSDHYYNYGGHTMTNAERRAYAQGPGINGTQCLTCQHREGAAAARASSQKAKDLGL